MWKYPKILLVLLLLQLLQTGGCVCPPRYAYINPEVPRWIYKIPQKAGWHYAWGSSGRSLNKKMAREFAVENAKKTLALTMGAKIIHKEKRINLFSRGVYTKITPLVSWKDLDCEVVDQWFDPEGKAGMGYQYFVLVRVKR